MRLTILFFFLAVLFHLSVAQNQEENMIKSFFNEALTDYTSYNNLEYLCKNYPGRITGSEEVSGAIEYVFQIMQEMNLDKVFKQKVQVPRWEMGNGAKAYIKIRDDKIEVSVIPLGLSIGTNKNGLISKVVEVHDFEELEKLGRNKIEGKIVFFNRPMDPTLINTFNAYSGAGNQRTQGAAEAAKYGAAGVVVRSLTTSLDDFPHTGVMRYAENGSQIPAVAISTNGANLLSELLTKEPALDFYFESDCKNFPETTSYNIIGEIKGSEFPEEIITVGGHLDAWEPGEGAHDDGAGCMQSIEVLRIYKKLGVQPKRTVRAVMFMDEEVAQRGGKEYARQAKLNNEKHYFALEADEGAFRPLGFGISAPDERLAKIFALKKYFEPYGITQFTKGGGGVDIDPLGDLGTPISSHVTEMQRYFDMHHSGNDTFEQVNFREFQMGSAAMASFIYLIDKFDL